jgi:hypothetical protein
MNIEDLQHIFRAQIEQSLIDTNIKLFFMLQDGDYAMIDRHSADDLEGLLPMLSSFQYVGNEGNIPRFVK